MKVNNRNKIRILKTSIEHLITVLGANIVISEEDRGSDIKSVMKTKKNAFVRAKYLIGKLQRIETAESKDINLEWYQDKISSLISSAEMAMGELSKIMKEAIDTEEGGTSINSAIDSKQDAFDHIEILSSGVIELDKIVKSIEDGDGLTLINDEDFKSSYAEMHSYEGFYAPVSGKYKPGYNKELDAIVISYSGKIGKIIECYGLRIALPKEPVKSSVFNARKSKKLQYWERQPYPEGLSKGNAHLYEDYIETEFHRRDNGFFFMNNGEMEYVTGANYMLLQHYKTDATGGYFNFRKAHRDLFYFLEACWVDDRSLGCILGKTRRTGATFCAVAFELTKAISIRESEFGLTSKKDKDAGKVFKKLTNMFKKMPFFFKPINTGEGFSKELAFNIPSGRTTKNSKDIQYDEMNSQLDYEATTEDAYDSRALRFYIADEFSKWASGNIRTHWSMVRKTLMEGGMLKGKAFVLSTVEHVTGVDGDADDAKCGDRFKKLYNESRLETRMEDGKTSSGLYKLFISAIDNYGGFIDMYGNCIKEDPETPIMGVNGTLIEFGVLSHLERVWRPHKDNPQKLNDEKRKDPITEEDMFMIASENSNFNVVNLQDEINYNNEWELINKKPNYKIGNFVWENGIRFSKVIFIECNNGKFAVSWIPRDDYANRVENDGGKHKPLNIALGALGVDPYKFDDTVDKRGSKGSIVGYLGNHPLEGIPKDEYFLLYLYKPQTLDVFFEDAIMCMWYYGMQALIENNVPEMLEVMYRNGMSPFSMRRPDKSLKDLSPSERRLGGIPSQDRRLIFAQAAFIERYIEDFIGYRSDGKIGKCPFNRLLSDWMAFNVNKRTKFDATVASGLAIYGANKLHARSVAKEAKSMKQKNVNIYDMIRFYNHN